MTDHFRATELRDRADDLRLSEQDRAERQTWREGEAEHHQLEDLYGPGPLDLEPWEPIVHRFGRRGQ